MDFDQYGQMIGAEYRAFTGALMGSYLTSQAAGRGIDGVSEFRLGGLKAVSVLLTRAIGITSDFTGQPIADVRAHAWLNQLHKVALKNLNDLIVKLMGGGARPADMLNRPAGAMGLLLQRQVAPRLTVRDRAGRAWVAETYVATSARDYAYQFYVDAQFERLQAEGATRVDILYADPSRNQTLTLDAARARRGEFFHVNGTARMRPHVQT